MQSDIDQVRDEMYTELTALRQQIERLEERIDELLGKVSERMDEQEGGE